MKAWKQTGQLIIGGILLVLALPAIAEAAQSASPNYQVNEVFFGTGGELNTCSANYCSKQAAGETAVGNSASSNYQAQGGFNTDRSPYIEFIVDPANTNLGVLNSGVTSTATGTFSVKTYLAGGYVVTNASNPPANSSHSLQALSTPTASNSSQEQFGINVVANTTGCGAPANFGADPVQVPSSTFSFGTAATGYNSCGLFKYVKGDIIALSSKSSGETDYTVSYIFNVSRVTPGGVYSLNHIMVATSTY